VAERKDAEKGEGTDKVSMLAKVHISPHRVDANDANVSPSQRHERGMPIAADTQTSSQVLLLEEGTHVCPDLWQVKRTHRWV